MRILGIDPGIARVGWAVLEKTPKVEKLLAYGCIETDKNHSEVARLKEIFDAINAMIDQYKVEQMAIEQLYFATNAKTAIRVGQARGVILLACYNREVAIFSYAPLEIKIAITGYGQADKVQMQQMVKQIAKLKTIPTPDDAADAIAAAYTHVTTQKMKALA